MNEIFSTTPDARTGPPPARRRARWPAHLLVAVVAVSLVGALGCREAEPPTGPESALRLTPDHVSYSTNSTLLFRQVSAGEIHSCGVTTDNVAYCWGSNFFGQLGDGTNTNSSVPVAVGGGHAFRQVSAGWGHSCGVTTANVAYCWGRNGFGQLGNGTNIGSNVPVKVAGRRAFRQVSAGLVHSCGVTTANAAYCWGDNEVGELGDGTKTSSNEPVAVFGRRAFRQVDAGQRHNCGVTTANEPHCWGLNDDGQLGIGRAGPELCSDLYCSTVPVPVFGRLAFRQVGAGDFHGCGVTTANLLYCWGFGFANGHFEDTNVPVLVSGEFSGVSTFRQVSAGGGHSCAVATDNVAYCWGSGSFGELGHNIIDFPEWVAVTVEGGLSFLQVSAGGSHSCGVTIANVAYCWGSNEFGQLGIGNNTGPELCSGTPCSTVPVPVSSPLVLVHDATLGFYNNFLGTYLDGTSELFPIPPDDPDFFPVFTPPDLSAVNGILGNWLGAGPPPNNGTWTPDPIAIPLQWDELTETAIVYRIEVGAAGIHLLGDFGVDNGIFVWVNGTFKFGAVQPGPAERWEYANIDLGEVSPGITFIQILREDHGRETGYHVRIRGVPAAPQP